MVGYNVLMIDSNSSTPIVSVSVVNKFNTA